MIRWTWEYVSFLRLVSAHALSICRCAVWEEYMANSKCKTWMKRCERIIWRLTGHLRQQPELNAPLVMTRKDKINNEMATHHIDHHQYRENKVHTSNKA